MATDEANGKASAREVSGEYTACLDHLLILHLYPWSHIEIVVNLTNQVLTVLSSSARSPESATSTMVTATRTAPEPPDATSIKFFSE